MLSVSQGQSSQRGKRVDKMTTKTKKVTSKYKIYDNGSLVPAWTRKPKNMDGVIELTTRNAEERKLKLRWYLPAK
jgi:hypothetical protein